MTLLLSSWLTGIVLLACGILMLRPNQNIRSMMMGFPRSKKCSYCFIGLATSWFLWRHVAFLSEADFGNYKLLIGAITLGTAILSFFYVADFLAVRGLAMIILLWSREVLDSAFLQDAESRLFLVSIIYILIVSALYFGAWPYRMRDFLVWLNQRTNRMTVFGWIFSFAGLSILVFSFTY